jgi:hypothetical protein
MRCLGAKGRKAAGIAIISLFIVACAACGDDATTPADGAVPEASVIPDSYGTLYPCSTPGQTCNAHNNCAINPICSQDKLCKPTSVMNCDDKLECTVDDCEQAGLCKNIPKAGTCKLAVQVTKGTTCAEVLAGKGTGGGSDAGPDAGVGADVGAPLETIYCCFDSGDRSPTDSCLTCDPTAAGGATKWSPANGGVCDDNNSCTKDDYCNVGVCKGTSFATQCADKYSCTKDLCDGKGGCLGNELLADHCLINGQCFKDGANNPAGTCFTCDVSKSQSAWTAIQDTCMIAGKCYKSGDKSPTGCGSCDPVKSSTDWTALPNVCLIDGKCYQPKAINPTASCAECDPTVSGTTWSVKGTECLIDGACLKQGDKDPTGCGSCDPTKDKLAWTLAAGPCSNCKKLFSGTIGKPCTSANAATVCGTGAICLLTTSGATPSGVCAQSCTPDNPATASVDEDSCPGRPDNVCAAIPFTSGATVNYCLHRCNPALGCNECPKDLVCHTRSGSMVGLTGEAVCLYYKTSGGCTTDADCNVTTGTKCNTASANCPTGQTCLAYSSTASTDGICAKSGSCDVISGQCKPHTLGKTGVAIGAPCAGDTDCANGMRCNLEYDENKYEKTGGSTCASNSECCSGSCSLGYCTTGVCNLLWRNGYCGISGCVFATTMPHLACPTGSECNLVYSSGLCQKSCSLTKASDCRGHAADKLGDYDCRDWSKITLNAGKPTSGPVCDLGPFLPCDVAQNITAITDCADFGDSTNSTGFACRDSTGVVLSNKFDPKGTCLDTTSSAGGATGDAGVSDAGAADSGAADAGVPQG